VKQRIKQSVPPGLWKTARLLCRALRHGVEVRIR
jgi:hypothetical protein